MPFALIEPLRDLFKDEVRRIGRDLGLPNELLVKHPFPGPGLAVRVLGEVSAERLVTLREADAIVVDEIRRAGLYEKVWQAFAVLLPVRSVGVMGDYRTYGLTIAVRAVESEDAMTADWVRLPGDVLERITGQAHPVRGHGVFGLDSAHGNGEAVGAIIAHHPHAAHREEHGKGLPNLLVEAGAADFIDNDIVRFPECYQTFSRHLANYPYGS